MPIPTVPEDIGKVFYKDNTGGTNFHSNEANINASPEKTEMALIMNMEVYKLGGFSAQLGNIQLNTNVTDQTSVLGGGEYKAAGKVWAVYTKASGKAYVMDAAGGNETLIKSGLSTTAIPNYTNFNSAVQVWNGADQPWEWNGTTTSTLASTPASWSTTPPLVAAVLGGKRIFAAQNVNGAVTIYFCALGNENDWNSANNAGQFTNFFGDSQGVNSIYNYGTALIIHTQKPGIYQITGSDPTTYTVTPIASNRSATGSKALCNINDHQYFFTGDSIIPVITTDLGIVKLGVGVEISYKIKPFLNGTDSELLIPSLDQSVTYHHINDSRVIMMPYFFKNQIVCYFKTTGNTQYDTAGIYDFDLNNWVFRQATLVSTAMSVDDNILTGTSTGQILQEFSGTTVVSGSFIKRLVSPFYDFGKDDCKKQILRQRFWFKSTTDLNFTVNYRTDYKTDIRQTQNIVTSGISTGASYGFGSYGVDTYASSAFYEDYRKLNMTGESIQWDMQSATSTLDFRIIKYGFEYEALEPK